MVVRLDQRVFEVMHLIESVCELTGLAAVLVFVQLPLLYPDVSTGLLAGQS